jgi:endonuclease/exonuclease/phosphatase family metal-dependent hydrolase
LVDALNVMTFNLRYASARRPHSWAERRPAMAALLRGESPHLIGTQEGLYQQLRDIEQDLGPRYAWIGTGREGGSRGEFTAIIYDTARLEPLEYDHFWLSATPDRIGSRDEPADGGERAGSPRMATCVRFEDRGTHGSFYALNTHLDNHSETARQRAATQLTRYLASDRLDPDLPRILTGDFNVPAAQGIPVYDTLLSQGKLTDSWTQATKRGEQYATWHGYRGPVAGGVRIDWILTSPTIVTNWSSINTYSDRGLYPSDHLPVQAVLVLPQGRVRGRLARLGRAAVRLRASRPGR